MAVQRDCCIARDAPPDEHPVLHAAIEERDSYRSQVRVLRVLLSATEHVALQKDQALREIVTGRIQCRQCGRVHPQRFVDGRHTTWDDAKDGHIYARMSPAERAKLDLYNDERLEEMLDKVLADRLSRRAG